MRAGRILRICGLLIIAFFAFQILFVWWKKGNTSHIFLFNQDDFVANEYKRLQGLADEQNLDKGKRDSDPLKEPFRHHHHLHREADGKLVPGEVKPRRIADEILQDIQKASKNAPRVRNGGILVNNLANQSGNYFYFPQLSQQEADNLPIFPFEVKDNLEDRIWNQMRYIPKQFLNGADVKEKLILFYNGMGIEEGGRNGLISRNCPVKACELTGDRSRFYEADVVLWQYVESKPYQNRPPNQVWAVFYLESPYHAGGFTLPNINWTATYLRNSTIVSPYYKYTPFELKKDPSAGPHYLPVRNYAEGKNKMVAWFVSNCGAHNHRLEFARELGKYIQVDIYGACGTHSCPRSHENHCFEKLTSEYKFYLAFENSNCRDYITEKFFKNGLQNDVLPIVMGAHPDDYRRSAPFHSYIHVEEFSSAKDLADYLMYLDKNVTAYNTYFSWKGKGFVDTNTFFICRLCMLAHEADNTKSILDSKVVNKEWTESCTTQPWVTPKPTSEHIETLLRMEFLRP